MGLDMYLTKSHYVKNWAHQSPDEKHKITVKKGNKVRKDIDVSKISQIVEDVAYWRKFNALHVWLVNNCADGVDDCRKVYVDKEAIRELVDTLEKVKASLDKSGTKKAKVEVGWSNGERCMKKLMYMPIPVLLMNYFQHSQDFSLVVLNTISITMMKYVRHLNCLRGWLMIIVIFIIKPVGKINLGV